MKEWLIRLKGGKSSLENLSKLGLPVGWSVTEDDGNYYLRSANFNSLANAGDVRVHANGFLEAIRAALGFKLGYPQAIEVDAVIGVEENGTREHSAQLTANAVIAGTLDDSIESLIPLAIQDKNVRDALRFFPEQNWVNLYKIYEIVRDDVGGDDKVVKNGWATKNEIKRFTQTAQSRDALGDAARHASAKFKSPSKPMSLSEAMSLIKIVLENWLCSKG